MNRWEISWVLGCHIEQKNSTLPGDDSPKYTEDQPDEHVLQFNVSILDRLANELRNLDGNRGPGRQNASEFSLVVTKG
jgi:hypothetical protein